MKLPERLARFHAAITGGAPLASAIDLVEGGAVDPLTRLRVYAHAYIARIAAVLAGDYPKLATLVDLRALTEDYLRAHPPSQPSLREAGAHVESFLAARGGAPCLADLARLERARTEVFDGPDATTLNRSDLADRDPAAFPALALRLVPSSHVVTLTTNADELWDAIESDRELPLPAPAARVVLVWRRDVTVIHRTLEVDEARVAHALAVGTTFGDACELLGGRPERAIELLVRWLDAACQRR
jgi:hypothetical protein